MTPVRLCKCGCGGEIPANASLQMEHLPGHRQRKYQRKKDARVRKALQAVGTTPTRAASGRKRRSQRPVQTRYALVQVKGATIEVLGFAAGKSKRAVGRVFGIADRDDLAAIAERHLPAVV